ncbi:HD-GYP domain-containing protein [Paenibacillus sp.]|uniref:HD-GYP domain-containing protein n=1 Tax=Paenibacillus sp. TaxID=58172 RepID=UPI0028118383|nr:HD-GYP domain-containing protein [Paenibacillus sp.]
MTSNDIASTGPYAETGASVRSRMIDEAVLEAGRLFEEVRATKGIPLADLRRNVIPMIQEAISGDTPLFGLFSALQAKDDYTYRHHFAVGAIASLIGKWVGLERQEQLQLTTAALLHDVGKMLIPEDVLNKPGKLTADEYTVMKSHTVMGYELLKRTVGLTHRQALVALQHHERLDGSGYPFGVTENKIDGFSRIVSVADMFHAMTSKRVYRDPSPFYEVLFQMERDTFGMLDPAITRLFVEKIMHSLIGQSVLLTDGREGVIVMVNVQEPLHPLIQIGSSFVDLSKESSVYVKQIFA